MEDRTGYWRVVARIRDGVSVNQAQAAVTTMAAHLEREYPETHAQERAFIFPEPLTRTEAAAASFMRPVAAVFMVMVSLVLLIACANVANLLLARAAERKREIAVRSALGAGRLRIARQLLVESTMLSLGGGIIGLVLAGWAGKLLSSVRVASDIPFQLEAKIDLRVFGFAMLVAVAAGILAGLAPAVHTVRSNLAEALKEGGRTVAAGGGKHRLRDLLVAGQVAVSLVLLVCTALFVRSMVNVSRLDLGFETENRLMLTVDTGLLGYEEEQGREFFREMLERVRSLPGVRSAATSRMVPVGFMSGSSHVFVEGESTGPIDSDETPRAGFDIVTPEYFDTIGISILEGRGFDEQDTETSRAVAVVNRTMADELWPGQDPLGKRFSTVGPDGPFLDVVGVARTSAYSIPGEPPQTFFYQTLKQRYQATQVLWVHAVSNPSGLVPAIRSEILALDPDMPIFDVRTLETHVSEGKAEILFKLPARMVGIFALIGAILAALGLYAVIAYSVSQRSHEIGVRVAMGATPSNIVRLILSKGLVLGGGGVAFGVLLAWLITGRFAYLFVGVGAGDPPTYIVVSLLVLLVALTATYIPARFRAARIDPVTALREE
jgi:predicted permease